MFVFFRLLSLIISLGYYKIFCVLTTAAVMMNPANWKHSLSSFYLVLFEHFFFICWFFALSLLPLFNFLTLVALC